MNYLITGGYVIAGLINFAPVLGVLSNARVKALYAVEFANADFALLLRHRAVLLGIIGALLLAAAAAPALRTSAGLAGLASMVSYIVLMWMLGINNENLLRVMWADVFAVVVLAAAFALHLANQ